MNNSINISVKDFTLEPYGRFPEDGEFNGEKFRQEYLESNFDKYSKLIIDLDGTRGYASSFREEAFGGLARVYGSDKVLDKVEFICKDEPPIIEVIIQEIKDVDG